VWWPKCNPREPVGAGGRGTADVIIIDTHSPDRRHHRTPLRDQPGHAPTDRDVSADGNTEKIREAVRAGVSAYVVDGLRRSASSRFSTWLLRRFEALQSLRDELEDTQISSRSQTHRAGEGHSHQQKTTEEEAYQWLRKMAMDENLKLAEVADQVIRAAKLLCSVYTSF